VGVKNDRTGSGKYLQGWVFFLKKKRGSRKCNVIHNEPNQYVMVNQELRFQIKEKKKLVKCLNFLFENFFFTRNFFFTFYMYLALFNYK